MLREGDFAGYSEGERDAVIHDFREIILNSGVLGFSCAVSLREWDKILWIRSIQSLRDPEFFCMSTAIEWSTKIAREHSPDKQVALVFDDAPAKREINERIFPMYHCAHNGIAGRDEVLGISFVSSEKFLPLQGADMIAWETYNYMHDWLRDPATPVRPHLARFAETGRFIAYGGGRSAIEAMADLMERLQDE